MSKNKVCVHCNVHYPTSAQRWVSGTGTVVVGDGRLTVSNATGSQNNKICFIDLEQVPPAQQVSN